MEKDEVNHEGTETQNNGHGIARFLNRRNRRGNLLEMPKAPAQARITE